MQRSWLILSSAILLTRVLSAGAAPPPATPPAEMTVALEWPRHGVTLFSGKGRTLRAWEPTAWARTEQGLARVAHYAPHVHPSQQRVIMLVCEQIQEREGAPWRLRDCSLREFTPEGVEMRTFSSLGTGSILASPVYSPDGARIAIVADRDVVLLDAGSGEIVERIEEVLHEKVKQSAAVNPGWSPIVRWSLEDGDLFLFGSTSQPDVRMRTFHNEIVTLREFGGEDVWSLGRLDRSTRRVTWLNLFNPDVLAIPGGPYVGTYATVREGFWTHVRAPLPDVPEVRGLFGSSLHSRLGGHHSSDGRYYFYLHFSQGFFSSTAVRRYDIERNRLKTLRTLERVLYRE